MHIYIDESGSFALSDQPGSWCVVAAYVVPERSRKKAEEVLRLTKIASGHTSMSEIKLKHLADSDYLLFLQRLNQLEGVLFCAAVDAGLNSSTAVKHHFAMQMEKLNENIPRIRHPTGRDGHQRAVDRFGGLSLQLYLQIVCQYELVSRIIAQSTLYFVQRTPSTLGHFRWRIDQKNKINSVFDDAFRTLAPAFMQSISLRRPQIMLEGADYRHFSRFDFKNGIPTYLKDEYGIDVIDGSDVSLIMGDDFGFVDSKSSPGVQIADLLASGVRRCLRSQFSNNDEVAAALGQLMVQAGQREQPIRLLSLDLDQPASAESARVVRLMHRHCRAMLIERRH